jgi:hypothetical protein
MNKKPDESAEITKGLHQDFIASVGDVPLVTMKCCINRPHKTLAHWDLDANMMEFALEPLKMSMQQDQWTSSAIINSVVDAVLTAVYWTEEFRSK